MTEPPVPVRPRTAAYALLAITAAALAVRLLHLDAESLWFDEAISLDVSRKGFAELTVDRAPNGLDGKPPLYFLMLRAWAEAFGRSPAALRALSVVPGTLVVPLLYLVAARWRGAVAGLLAAGLAAGSPFLVRYSQEARDYAWLFLFATASFLCLDRARERPTLGRLAAWSATLALCLWTSVFGLAVFATQALYLAGLAVAALVRPRGERPRLAAALPLAAGLLAAAACFAPWVPVLSQRAERAARHFWITEPDLGNLWSALGAFAGMHRLLAVLAPLVLLGAWRELFGKDADRRRGAFLLAWLLGPLLLPWIASRVVFPMFVQRGTIVAVGGGVLLAASGLDALRPRRAAFRVAVLVAAAAAALGVGRVFVRTEKEDWRGLAARLSREARAGEVVLVANRIEEVALRAYAPLYDLTLSTHEAAAAGPDVVRGRARVWLVVGHDPSLVPAAREALVRSGYTRVAETPLFRVALERWEP